MKKFFVDAVVYNKYAAKLLTAYRSREIVQGTDLSLQKKIQLLELVGFGNSELPLNKKSFTLPDVLGMHRCSMHKLPLC
jgi:hypothetical protein